MTEIQLITCDFGRQSYLPWCHHQSNWPDRAWNRPLSSTSRRDFHQEPGKPGTCNWRVASIPTRNRPTKHRGRHGSRVPACRSREGSRKQGSGRCSSLVPPQAQSSPEEKHTPCLRHLQFQIFQPP